MSDDPPSERTGDQFADRPEDGSHLDPEMQEAFLGAVGFEATTDFGRVIDLGDRYLGMVTEGNGPKLRLGRELDQLSSVGADIVASAVNELLAEGLTPVAFQNVLTVESIERTEAMEIASGLADAAERAGILLLRGTLRTDPEGAATMDLLGTAAGIAEPEQRFPGTAATGDRLVGFPSSGIHSGGIEAARAAVEGVHDLAAPLPGESEKTIGAAIIEPTRVYTYLGDALGENTVHAAVQLQDGAWQNLSRMGDVRFAINDPLPPAPIFELIREAGDIDQQTMYRTFNMGTGFVVAAPESAAAAIAGRTDGRIIGAVERGEGVSVGGIDIT